MYTYIRSESSKYWARKKTGFVRKISTNTRREYICIAHNGFFYLSRMHSRNEFTENVSFKTNKKKHSQYICFVRRFCLFAGKVDTSSA